MNTLQLQESRKLPVKIYLLKNQKIYWFKNISSTMDFAKQKAKEKEECVVISESQTSGRGKLEKKWISPEGGLWCSIVWAEDSAEILNNLFFLVASAIYDVLKSYGIKTKIKLPNDIYYKDKKIAGILIEKKGIYVILGIGMNINNKISDAIPEAISYYEITNKTISIEKVLENMLNILLYYRKKFPEEKENFLKKWSEIL
jgi:BirA family biotin operon repressor/biotin-[acetyl-CoA-carboxylase] ligase